VVAKWLFVFLILISALPTMVNAQPTSVILQGLPPLSARPEEFVTVVYTLQNQGLTLETFDFEITLPSGFTQVATLASVTLPAGAQEFVFVNVLVPNNAEARDFTIQLAAISRTDPTLRLTSDAIIRVQAAAKIRVRPIGVQENTEDGLIISFSVQNTGNVLDQIEFSATSFEGFQLQLTPTQAELASNQQTVVQVRLLVPPTAGSRKTQDRITFVASSTQFSNNSDSVTLSVELTPPLPDQIGTGLGWTMPTRVAFSFAQSNVPKSFLGLLSLTGGGKFNDTDGFDFRLSLDHTLRIRTVAVGVENSVLQLDLGDVGVSYDRFVGVSGRGAVLVLETPLNASLSAAVVSQGEIVPVAANFSLDLGQTRIGVSSEVALGQVPSESLISASLSQSLLNLLSFEAQGAFSFSDGLFAPAFQTGASFSQDMFDLNMSVAKFFPNFLGTATDQQQLQFSQVLGLDQLILSSLIDIQQNNVGLNPDLPTVGRNRILGLARLFPGEKLPTISAVLDVRTEKNITAIETTDTQAWSGSLSVFQPLNIVSLALSTSVNRSVDRLARTDAGTLTISSLLGWNSNGFSRTIRVAHVSNIDFNDLFVSDRSLTLETTMSFKLPIGQLSFGLSNSAPNTTLTASLNTAFPQGSFNTNGRVSFNESTLTGFSVQLNFSRNFGTRLPFIPIKGQIEGRVFNDINNNGLLDVGENLAEIVVVAGGGRVRTDTEGFFRLPPLEPGNYLVNVSGMASQLRPTIELPRSVNLRAGERMQIDIPLRAMASIEGIVYNDLNSNGQQDLGEDGFEGAIFTLSSSFGEDRQTRSTDRGRFSFVDLEPGEYTVNLNEANLPRRFIATTPGKITVQVLAQSTTDVSFGVVEQAPEIRFNLNEPTALFAINPELPTVDEMINFDANESFDPDGDIMLYEWDFNGDGVIDATGPLANFSFDTEGIYLATLTVTDNDGNKDDETKVIQVIADQ